VAPGATGAVVAPGATGAVVAPGATGAVVAPGVTGAVVAPEAAAAVAPAPVPLKLESAVPLTDTAARSLVRVSVSTVVVTFVSSSVALQDLMKHARSSKLYPGQL